MPGSVSASHRQRTTRTLRVIAQDPGFRKDRGGGGYIVTANAELPAEELLAGPTGYRVKVIDYDVSTDTLYAASNIVIGPDGQPIDAFREAPDKLLLTDPRFHQQNVYAIVMRTLSRFEKALGRRVAWGCDGHQLHVVPHAFAEPNAFYSRADRALFFGYFRGRDGNTIFTCLSHDVIAHETTHAILDGLRSRFFEPSSPDQAAFHEGFADIVAMLSIFSLRNIVRAMLLEARMPEEEEARESDAEKRDVDGLDSDTRKEAEETTLIDGRLLEPEWLKNSAVFGLAEEMGRDLSAARGSALRRSVELDPEETPPDSPQFLEEHRRGELLAAAMLNAFLEIWVARIRKIGPIEGQKKDLSAVVEAGTRVADHLLTMAIRAIDYCPPVDLSFPDYLSALLTIDSEVVPDDDAYDYRGNLLRQFGRFGIRPAGDSGPDGTWARLALPLTYSRTHFESLLNDKQEVFRFLWENRRMLEVDERGYVEIESVRPAMRIAPDGFILRETIAEYVQMLTLSAAEFREMNIEVHEDVPPGQRIRIYGGGTLVFDEYGQLKYHIAKYLARDSDDVARQTDRLHHLWRSGYLFQPDDDASARLQGLHLARAGAYGGADATR
jgi:hypothetical protein